MTLPPLPKSFEPAAIEARWAPLWEASGLYEPTLDPAKPSFCIQLPPPNVTGTLHMGHAFNQTIMDALTRYHRMRGYNTLWVPGTDHAGIATQIVVERQLQEAGLSRHDLGRKNFVAQVWDWKKTSGATITQQMRRMGDSVSWKHEYFTMDEKLSTVVTETFVRLYDEGLIYRGKRLVNWDPVLKSAVSDLEVESEEEDGQLWLIRYPLVDGGGAAGGGDHAARDDARRHRADGAPRRRALCQRSSASACSCRCTGREIPVIADAYVDREFGTGVVKVTPAHDHNDYAVGQRHGLPMIGVLTLDATINDNAPQAYRGLDRFAARKQSRGRPGGAGPARRDTQAQAHGAALRAHRADRRADAHRPVVRGDDASPGADGTLDRRQGDRRGRVGRGEVRARAMGQHLQPVDAQHPGLVHLAPALVGPPDPGVVRQRRRAVRRAATRTRRAHVRRPPATPAR